LFAKLNIAFFLSDTQHNKKQFPVFSVTHCVGHGINLYHISTQPSSDANCYFREYFRA